MKKFITLILAATLALSLTACSSNENSTDSESSTSNKTPAQQLMEDATTPKDEESPYAVTDVLTAITDAVDAKYGAGYYTTDIDDSYLTLIGIDLALVKDYSGKIVGSADVALVVEAKPEDCCLEDIQTAMQSNLDYIVNSNANYDGYVKDKVNAARVITKGNYVMLVIAGTEDDITANGTDAIFETIETAIDNFFK